MKPKEKADDWKPVYWREIYLKADKEIICDGCGEPAIVKGTPYMQQVRDDGSRLNLCQRCIFALKFHLASTGKLFEFGPGDLKFEKLPNRFQSAWMLLRQRMTKDFKAGVEKNEAWRKACQKLLNELGMRHVYERDVMLAEQERLFADERKKTLKDIDGIKRRIKKVKSSTEASIERLAKARLGLKNKLGDLLEDEELSGCFQELVDAMMDIRKSWEQI